jgi:hypothetical protein
MFKEFGKKPAFGNIRGRVEATLAVSILALMLGGQVAYAVDTATTAAAAKTTQATRLASMKDTLKLTDAQNALLQKADAASVVSQKVMMDEQIKRMQARRDALGTTTTKTAPDLRKLATEQDAMQATRAAEQKKVRETWLAFYDSLSADQKMDAAKFVQARMAMGGAGHEQMGRMNGRNGKGQKGDHRMGGRDGGPMNDMNGPRGGR